MRLGAFLLVRAPRAVGTGGRVATRILVLFGASILGITQAFAQTDEGTHTRMGVLAWGDGSHGQCAVPKLQLDAKLVQVACGTSHSIAIQSNGELVAWGGNDFGQLRVPKPPAGHFFSRISASDHNLALVYDGALLAWGRNDSGQCDVPLLPRGVTWTAISAGGLHSAGLTSEGDIYCWGNDRYHQCDLMHPPLGIQFVAVSAGGRHTLALRSDGRLVAWGDNSFRQCQLPPMPVDASIVAISAGGLHSLALTSDGRVLAWGANTHGQLDLPAIPYGHRVVEIAAGGEHSLARLDDGSLLAWGDDSFGQTLLPKNLVSFEVVRLAAGGAHNVVLFQVTPPDIVPVCVGDGSSEPCPCHNDSLPGQYAGCRNSTGVGAKLTAMGHPEILADDLQLHGDGFPKGIVLILQGQNDPATAPGGGAGKTLSHAVGSGLLCLREPYLRLVACDAAQGEFVFPNAGQQLSMLGGVRAPGNVFYQVWYRDPRFACTPDTSNFTNGLRIGWTL